MACRWPGDKPLSELMMASLLTHIDAYMRHSASMIYDWPGVSEGTFNEIDKITPYLIVTKHN